MYMSVNVHVYKNMRFKSLIAAFNVLNVIHKVLARSAT